MKPRPALPGNGAPGERLSPQAHTTSGRGKKPWPHLDQALDQAVNGPLNCFTTTLELPDYMQEVLSQNNIVILACLAPVCFEPCGGSVGC